METAAPAAPASSSPAPSSAPAAPAATNTPAQAQPPKAAAPAAPAKPELFEYKINGKVQKLTAAQRDQYVSLGFASDERFKEGANMRKQAEAVIGKLKDPKNVMQALQDPALGLTKEQIRESFEEWYTQEFIEAEKLTPEQKELRDAKAKLKKYDEDEKGREAEKQKAHEESLTAQARQEIQGQIIEALESSGLPRTNFTIRRLAYWIQRNNANGFNAPTEVLVGQVRNEFNGSIRDHVDAADGETLIQLLGDSVIQKVRKYDLEQLRKLRGGQGSSTPSPEQGSASPGTPRKERAPTSVDVNQRIRELQRTGRY